MKINIWYGTNENRQLSNLSLRPFKDTDNREYVSVEHAYQTWKSGAFDPDIYNCAWKAGSKFPGKLGTKIKDNWNIKLMEKLIRASFLDERNFVDLSILEDSYPNPLTHIQDKGIWAKEFPRLITKLRVELLINKLGPKPK